MSQIPAGPPPAKPSVIETANDFFAWLDEARDAEERVQEEDALLAREIEEQARRQYR